MRSLLLAAGLAALALGATGAQAGQTPDPATEEIQAPMEPAARAALDKMAAYLRTLNSFELSTETSLDLVLENGQRVQLDGAANYKVQRPNSFVISVNTDWKKRTFYYDGKKFTVNAPELGYYATAEAPATIADTLDVIYEKFGISLPIEDLFRWNDPSNRNTEKLDSAMYIGPATVNGAKTEHYAFRQGEVDWQIWIQTGEQPLPRKIVIVDRSDLAQPQYSARLNWTLNPTLKAEAFTFVPGKDAKAIRLSSIPESQP